MKKFLSISIITVSGLLSGIAVADENFAKNQNFILADFLKTETKLRDTPELASKKFDSLCQYYNWVSVPSLVYANNCTLFDNGADGVVKNSFSISVTNITLDGIAKRLTHAKFFSRSDRASCKHYANFIRSSVTQKWDYKAKLDQDANIREMWVVESKDVTVWNTVGKDFCATDLYFSY